LVQGLPPGSKTVAALSDREWWSDEKSLLVRISNLLDIQNWQFHTVNWQEPMPFPDLIRFPGEDKPKPVSPSRLRHLMKLRAGHGALPDGDS
jgi:hypothetical protein